MRQPAIVFFLADKRCNLTLLCRWPGCQQHISAVIVFRPHRLQDGQCILLDLIIVTCRARIADAGQLFSVRAEVAFYSTTLAYSRGAWPTSLLNAVLNALAD